MGLTGKGAGAIGGNAANPAKAFGTVAGQFQGRDLGLVGGANTNTDHLAPAVDIGAKGLFYVGTDGREPLGELCCGEAVLGEPLLIESPELFELVGFEALEVAVDRIDGGFSGETVKNIVLRDSPVGQDGADGDRGNEGELRIDSMFR